MRRVLVRFGTLLFLLAVSGLPNVAFADEPSRAGLVVQFADGRVETRCLSFEEEINGADLLMAHSGFDTVVSRAFPSLADFVRLSGHLCAPAGRLVAMKGRSDADELADVPGGWTIMENRPLRVPGIEGQRHAIVLRRDSETRVR